MEPERWHQIDEIFHAALNLDEIQRPAFIRETCSGDETLRLELERLLALQTRAENFLESPAVEMAARALADSQSWPSYGDPSDPPAVLPGQTISHYRIKSELGSGGMGSVYEAEDIRLGRRVAVKFLRANLARHPDALRRFEGEARAASSLNHTNICTIYEVEDHDGQPIIVMELLEGQSLQQRICAGPASLAELLEVSIQISDALAAAHAKGVVHRDIKPANIFLVGDDRRHVKVLDFGLAKVMRNPLVGFHAGNEPLTLEGVIAGTASYMSPEQARGQEIDERSDLFSLGVVLYELATSKQPFSRTNAMMTIDAILNSDPPSVASLNSELPAELDRIIAKALWKERELRYASAAAFGADLRRLQDMRSGKTHQLVAAPRRSRAWNFAAAAFIAAIASAGAVYLYAHRPHRLTAKDTIVIAEFENKTGDAVFDGTLRQALNVQLQQSPFLSLVPEERIQGVLRLMSRPAESRFTAAIAREVCERIGSAAVLEGSIELVGSRYVLWLRALNCHTADVLFEKQRQAATKEEVLNTLSGMAGQFRTGAGEPLATVEKYSRPLAEVTTTSLEALKVYSDAIGVHTSIGGTAALPLYERAIALDPRFAMAYASLGNLYGEIGESDLSAENTLKAWQFSDRTSDVERFFITATYDLRVLGNMEKLQETCEAWSLRYPRDPHGHGLLAGGTYLVAGNYEKASEEAERAIALDPEFALGYTLAADSKVSLGRLSEAQGALQDATVRRLAVPEFLESRYRIAFLKGDQEGMDREIGLSRRTPEGEAAVAYQDSFGLAYFGHLQKARIQTRRAFDLAQQTGHRERAALYTAAAAVREALFGNLAEARRNASTALALSADREVKYGAALTLALVGDATGAQNLAADLEDRFPEDTSVRFSYLPSIRARLEVNRGDARKAIGLLAVTVPHELGLPRSAFHGLFGALYPIYLRGEAWLKAGNAAEAAREFRRVLDHRTIVVSDPIGALASLQLGRASVLSGKNEEGKAAYMEFLALWKDADPDIPILKQAKAEYARLR